MIRRVHVEELKIGSIALNPAEAHHIRDVLRLGVSDLLELFDDAGAVGIGPITHITPGNVVVLIDSITTGITPRVSLTVAAAVPKGDRADWMIEKLTELGVARFIPLITERSVVLPAGKNKIQRWERIAVEAAKQSRRNGVMVISPLTLLDDAIAQMNGWFLTTGENALSVDQAPTHTEHGLFIGPEGGWTSAEIDRMKSARLQGVGLTSTVLRVETAAISAAAIVLCRGRNLMETHLPSSND